MAPSVSAIIMNAITVATVTVGANAKLISRSGACKIVSGNRKK